LSHLIDRVFGIRYEYIIEHIGFYKYIHDSKVKDVQYYSC